MLVHCISLCDDDLENFNLLLQRQLLLMTSVTIHLILPDDLMATVDTMELLRTMSNVLSSMYSKFSCIDVAYVISLSAGVQSNCMGKSSTYTGDLICLFNYLIYLV
jgi:hypothetical protein